MVYESEPTRIGVPDPTLVLSEVNNRQNRFRVNPLLQAIRGAPTTSNPIGMGFAPPEYMLRAPTRLQPQTAIAGNENPHTGGIKQMGGASKWVAQNDWVE